MANDREQAKDAILSRSDDDPELADALRGGQALQLKLAQEANRHTEEMRGWVGHLLGPKESAPTFIAFLAMVFGLVLFSICLFKADVSNAQVSEFWSRWAERTLAFAVSAFTFIAGKGLSKSE